MRKAVGWLGYNPVQAIDCDTLPLLMALWKKIKSDKRCNQVFFISTTWELSVNRIDLHEPTLAGPPRANPGAGALAALHLDNQPYIFKSLIFNDYLFILTPYPFLIWDVNFLILIHNQKALKMLFVNNNKLYTRVKYIKLCKLSLLNLERIYSLILISKVDLLSTHSC